MKKRYTNDLLDVIPIDESTEKYLKEYKKAQNNNIPDKIYAAAAKRALEGDDDPDPAKIIAKRKIAKKEVDDMLEIIKYDENNKCEVDSKV